MAGHTNVLTFPRRYKKPLADVPYAHLLAGLPTSRATPIAAEIVALWWTVLEAENYLPLDGAPGFAAADARLDALYDQLDAVRERAWRAPVQSEADLVTLAIIAAAMLGPDHHGDDRGARRFVSAFISERSK